MANAAGEEDRISELPDEILLCILRRLNCSKQSAQTVILSKRWRRIYDSYPIVEFRSAKCRGFQQFVKSQMQRFSRNIGLRMEVLKVKLKYSEDNLCALEKLLDLASERKVEELDINADYASSFRLLSNSSAKNLRFTGILLKEDVLPVLQVSYSWDLEIEEIAAPELQTLRLSNSKSKSLVQLSGLPAALSSLQSLKSLTLELDRDEGIKQIKFSSPKLEEFTLHAPVFLKEIEKCEIHHAAANCRWEAYCYDFLARVFVDQFKEFASRFNNKFEAINLRRLGEA
ncbi:F-box/FBD/LRR-repeat protein At5g53840 [Linum grandiflorum]